MTSCARVSSLVELCVWYWVDGRSLEAEYQDCRAVLALVLVRMAGVWMYAVV